MDTSDELQKKVQNWIKEQGYPLEMKVATALIDEGFDVRQGSYYIDPESNESREIDIISRCGDIIGIFDVYFMIECKSNSKPWILFTSENTLTGYNRFFAYCLYSEFGKAQFIDKTLEISRLGEKLEGKFPWFHKEGRNAYAVTQAFTTGADNTYKAAMSALKAAIAVKISQEENRPKHLTFIFPVIVIDGSLFESYLNTDGELVVDAIEKGFLHFPQQISGLTGTTIHVLTLGYLPHFITAAKKLTSELLNLFGDVSSLNFSSLDERARVKKSTAKKVSSEL
ncbi:hypothetical protein [Cylindrospermum sp. FACHB-282]|uniref:hypothetical protein n=1 Tax=Cylindrospermum sp. FACHB-282 TaxID=2692794 RepID=UPI00168626B7|nr:hypothetical protein [Cylindrospermum sp. FACHB-282]MBD2388203.1 hypothetical protein [Cylindrospermum sp. FACHB-282]